jgi:DNA adenine methylase
VTATAQNKQFLRPAFKIHGGKRYLAPWVISLFPKDYQEYDYVEPFVGAGSVFLNKTPAHKHIEVINDLDTGVVQIFRALRDEPDHFISRLKKITYSDRVFKRELKRQGGEYEDYLDHAVSEFVVRRMSRGGLKKAFGWSDRQRGGQPGDVNAWKTIIQSLPLIADRLKDTRILNKDAMKVISAFDGDNVLFYVDPPYPHESRVSTDAYGFEMSNQDHARLAEELNKCRGKVVLSGYPCGLYDKLFEGWRCETKQVANHSSQQKTKGLKVECCWMNF